MSLNKLFIETEISINKKEFQPASYLRREFTLSKAVRKAKLTMTAFGVYKGFINGQLVSDQQFMPGFTHYKKRLQVQTYDVTALLTVGKNAIGVILGDGWYRGKLGGQSNRYFYGDKVKLAAVLDLEFADGAQWQIATDHRWKATQDGPIRKSDWKDGEIYNATREMPGWSEPGFDDSYWHPVYLTTSTIPLVPSEGEAIREKEQFRPIVLTTPDGATVLDFSQNIFGYVEFNVSGNKGHTVKLILGETLDENGNFTQKNLIPGGAIAKIFNLDNSIFQEIEYTLKDGPQTYKPSFTAQGFRYAKLENWPEAVDPQNFKAIAVYSDMQETGSFSCSNKLINRLFQNSVWSQKGNFLDIPTDCPTRERAGWTGDIAAFCEAGSYQMDSYKFLAKWLKDLALQQAEDGKVPNVVPDVGLLGGRLDGSAGWSDAAVIVPYTLYKIYGRRQILQTQYESMKKWVDFVAARARKSRLSARFRKNPYNEFLVDTGYHWGEWLEPGHTAEIDLLKNLFVPDAEVATAYYAYSAGLLAEIATILGQERDAVHYAELSRNAKTAYRYTFTNNGIVESDRQALYVRPIALDLLPEDEKAQNAELLNKLVVQNKYRIGTGFLTTPFILPVLTDYGYVHSAYKMIENKKQPGWLYSVQKGATTILEDWDGIGEDGTPSMSFNHYAFGAVTKWFFTHVAGINPLEPGFARVQIKPYPEESLEYANCTFLSVQGPIKSNWQIDNGQVTLSGEVPVSAEVHMPDGLVHTIEPGPFEFSQLL